MAEQDDGAPRSGFWATVMAVLSAFVGIRKSRDYQRDAQQLKPRQIIVAGVIGGFIFVLAIVMLVKMIVANVQPG